MLVRRVSVLAAFAVLIALPLCAEAPVTSPRPMARGGVDTAPVSDVVSDVTGALMLVRPRARPFALAPVARGDEAGNVAGAVANSNPAENPVGTGSGAEASTKRGLFGFLRPQQRPKIDQGQKAAAVRVKPAKEATVSRKGSVCGIDDIRGEQLSPITSRIKGCGVQNPVRITSVAGIKLANGATINCDTAKALRSWIKKGLEPVYGKGKVVELRIAASYACRPRNNKSGARVSEHGRGNAIDISAMTFANGKTTAVSGGFDKNMRLAHKAACGIFGTTLGPGSDGYHEDHMHFDIARYRGGPYCR